MSTEPLLTISAFARAVDLAPSTLRYYDEAGLLPPAEVDPHTGYRYYTPDLERRATLVRRMREVGLSVEAMRAVLGGTTEQAARILRAHVEGAHDSALHAARVADDVLAALDPTPAAAVTVTVDGAEAAAALRRVATAAADEAGPLGGVLLDVADDGLTVVATDRYRMACWRLPVAEPRPGEARGLVTGTAVPALADRLARLEHATVTLVADELTVDGEGVPTLAADRFPAYRLVLPPPATGRTTLPLAGLRAAVSAVGDGPVRLAATPTGADVGGYADAPRVRLAGVTTGDPRTVWLARDLLAHCLETCVGESVTVGWTGPDRPVRLSPVEQRRLDVLLMPVHPPG